jgi:basic membrane protein A
MENALRSSMKTAAAMSVAALVLAACGNSTATTPGAGGTTNAAKAMKVGMAYDVGGRGDQSFNDAAAAGLDKAKAELGAETKEATAVANEPESAREERLQQLIDAGYTSVVAVGFAYAPAVKKVAAQNPDVKFALIDSLDATGPNIENLTFAENEGSFLVGAAAALKSKTGKVGFIGGVNTDLIKKFEAGYVMGAKAVNPAIKTQVKYLTQPPDYTGFGDPAKGKTAAEGMFQQGVDVVYAAAGGSGGGVFTAASAAGKMAIGVDSDQAVTAPPAVKGVIITSMLKKVDVATFDFIKSLTEGKFVAGTKVYDLKVAGVGYSTTGGKIDDIRTKLDDFKAQIIDGKIVVPTKP